MQFVEVLAPVAVLEGALQGCNGSDMNTALDGVEVLAPMAALEGALARRSWLDIALERAEEVPAAAFEGALQAGGGWDMTTLDGAEEVPSIVYIILYLYILRCI